MTILSPEPDSPFYDAFNDESVSTILWDLHQDTQGDSNVTVSEYAESVLWDIDAQDGNGTLTGYMFSKKDIRYFGTNNLTCTFNGFMESAGVQTSGYAIIRLTDDNGNTENLLLLNAPASAVAGEITIIQASFDINISEDGNTINVKRHYTGYSISDCSTTVIADDTDIDVSGWDAVYIESYNSAYSYDLGSGGKMLWGRILLL